MLNLGWGKFPMQEILITIDPVQINKEHAIN